MHDQRSPPKEDPKHFSAGATSVAATLDRLRFHYNRFLRQHRPRPLFILACSPQIGWFLAKRIPPPPPSSRISGIKHAMIGVAFDVALVSGTGLDSEKWNSMFKKHLSLLSSCTTKRWRARSRLYRSRCLTVIFQFAAFFKI